MTRTYHERKQEADQIIAAYADLGKQALWADGKGGGFWVKDAKPAYRSLEQARRETRESRRFLLGNRVMVGQSDTGTITGYSTEHAKRYFIRDDDGSHYTAPEQVLTRLYTSDTDWCAFPYDERYCGCDNVAQGWHGFWQGSVYDRQYATYPGYTQYTAEVPSPLEGK